MKKPNLPTAFRDTRKLERVRQQLSRWRSSHRQRARIPEELWRLLTEIAQEYGVAKTVRLFRLDYLSVKKRVEACGAGVRPAEFVEFVPQVSNCTCEWAVEVEGHRGRRMRIQCKGDVQPDLVELSDRLWRVVR